MADHNKPTILIVDDNPANLGVLFDSLRYVDFKVLTAEDGKTALKRVQYFKPDLILLDIMMPGIDGFETCRRLKADEESRSIPIIFMTALSDTVDKVKGFELGAVDYVTKPIDVAEVVARIKTHLTLQDLQKKLQIANRKLTEQLQELEQTNFELEQRNAELQEALNTIKTLTGLVPICAWCHSKIQNEEHEWIPMELYLKEHSDAEFTHGICPDCEKRFRDQTSSLFGFE
jgi:DNA-binding response OmpR family regulator